MRRETLPIDIMLPLMDKYRPLAFRIFNYLNGYINPYNPCVLTIKMYSTCNYAEFRKPNSVTIFLGSIIAQYHGSDYDIKTTILMTVAHELSHSCQNTDMVRYSKDPYYKKMVEDTNEGYTEQWLLAHMNEIQNEFGIVVEYTDYAKTNLLPKANQYQTGDIREYYIHTLIDVVYRRDNFIEVIANALDASRNIVFNIEDSELVVIKTNGVYLQEAIPKFGELIFRYCRAGLGIMYFTAKLTKTPITIPINGVDESATWLRLLIGDKRYCPIVGIGTVPEIESKNEHL